MKTILLSILAALMLAASGALALQAGGSASVSIKDLRYSPASVTVKTGDTVTWTNQDDMDHTVAADDGSFASGTLKTGDSYSYRFAKKGTFAYHCRLHPRMKGTVRVD